MFSEKGSHINSIKKSPEKIMGKYFFFFIVDHFCRKSRSKKKLAVRPIKETLIGNFPKQILAAKEERKNK